MMTTVPRSRWLPLLLAALLCVLGGANRGRVPAHEREGSRTADEPAALRTRGAAVDRERADEERTPARSGEPPAILSAGDTLACAASFAIAGTARSPAAISADRGLPASARGPPPPASMV